MVKNRLYICGLGEAWLSQSVGNTHVFMSLFRQHLIDIYTDQIGAPDCPVQHEVIFTLI